MVPVPEEHVEAVMQFILRAVAQASVEDWDEASLNELWDESDEATRSLLSFTGRATAAGTDLEIAEAARQMQLNAREATAIINELVNVARNGNRPSLITIRATTERLPNGRMMDKRVLVMPTEIADLVREVERLELMDAGLPGASE
jgi:hypothetical protein